ncbi:helix-hairpin-helix domain-containing protein [Lachnoclostridium edouardi]|uniref:helix-hairpin-helix domain-containing protein n=1 Tax=Lachnoclostridium edouardi TaxID=1926283 RepID=UPI000C7A3CC1|nr:helix-hairpin-helix domain-containing protein [Lachnoclostridium edouardi]
MKKQQWKMLLAVVCMLAAGACYSCGGNEEIRQDSGSVLELQGEKLAEESAQKSGETDENLQQRETEALNTEEEKQNCHYVHICGEVVFPGVYEVEEGSRVFQAVEKAGGFTPEAAEEYLNLAEPTADGMKIIVPSLEEVRDLELYSSSVQEQANKAQGDLTVSVVNLNTATREQLMTLAGIGESRAEDIIRYREEKGKFRSIEEIKNIPGIKDAVFEKIKDKIGV